MSIGIKGKLIEATYENKILSGIFVDENGNQYSIINATAIPPTSTYKGGLFLFKKDQANEAQDYLDDFCLSIAVANCDKLNRALTGTDFTNQLDSSIFLKDTENINTNNQQ